MFHFTYICLFKLSSFKELLLLFSFLNVKCTVPALSRQQRGVEDLTEWYTWELYLLRLLIWNCYPLWRDTLQACLDIVKMLENFIFKIHLGEPFLLLISNKSQIIFLRKKLLRFKVRVHCTKKLKPRSD